MTPVERWGTLRVVGNKVCDSQGQPVQLRGMSLFWSQWSTRFWNASVVDHQVDDWNANIIRAAMGVDEEGTGYLHDPSQKELVKRIVDQAIARGIYVVIDWHDHWANAHTDQAKAFFREMARTYGHKPNVIFEVFNEPTSQSWGDVKGYAEAVIGEIRAAGSQNLVIVGSPEWSQRVDLASWDPIRRYDNVAYTLHFYAATHKQWLRDRADAAMRNGIALFVTEWGTSEASGNGTFDEGESWAWVDWMNRNGISSCNWSLNDKQETSAALRPGASGTGPWPDAQLTQSGRFVKAYCLTNPPPQDEPSELPAVVTLKAKANNQYVCADDWGKAALVANRNQAQGWETFDVVKNGDGTYSFKARANGLFVCADNGGKAPLIANRSAIGDWEKFFVTRYADGSISLKAKVNGLFVCADQAGASPLVANRTTAQAWEQFWVQ